MTLDQSNSYWLGFDTGIWDEENCLYDEDLPEHSPEYRRGYLDGMMFWRTHHECDSLDY